MIARQSHTKPLAGAVDGTQAALVGGAMRHYVLVNRKFNELKSMILLNIIRGGLSEALAAAAAAAAAGAEASPPAMEQSATRDAESEKFNMPTLRTNLTSL